MQTQSDIENGGPTSLESILAPLSLDEFLAGPFGRTPVHVPGAKGRFRHLLDWGALARLLECTPLDAPQLAVVKAGGLVPVRDRSLQGERRGEAVDVGRVAGGLLLGHEAEVVVAMGGLRRAAGVDDVHLRRDLVTGTQPRHRYQVQDVVGIVVDERPRVVERQLLQSVPDAVVGPGLGEVVAGRHAAPALVVDQLTECGGRAIDHTDVVECSLEDDDPWTVHERARECALNAIRRLPTETRRSNSRTTAVA